ncbi:MAG: murein hydrolase activator EnvC [Rhodothermales bacterium]
MALFIFLTGCTTVAPQIHVSSSFDDQKGKLAWPSEGTIIESFGTVVNPVYGTKTKNLGILISTREGAEVKTVYDGMVVDILAMPEFGNVITISHGDYTTVYGNLSFMNVTEGMSVNAGKHIGNSGTENEPKGESVFFAVFQDGVEINPEVWLKKE